LKYLLYRVENDVFVFSRMQDATLDCRVHCTTSLFCAGALRRSSCLYKIPAAPVLLLGFKIHLIHVVQLYCGNSLRKKDYYWIVAARQKISSVGVADISITKPPVSCNNTAWQTRRYGPYPTGKFHRRLDHPRVQLPTTSQGQNIQQRWRRHRHHEGGEESLYAAHAYASINASVS